MPVWEEQQLGNFSHWYAPAMSFQAPLRPAAHSAFYLSIEAGGDQLIGRADNGECLASPYELHALTAETSAVLQSSQHGPTSDTKGMSRLCQASYRLQYGWLCILRQHQLQQSASCMQGLALIRSAWEQA